MHSQNSYGNLRESWDGRSQRCVGFVLGFMFKGVWVCEVSWSSVSCWQDVGQAVRSTS